MGKSCKEIAQSLYDCMKETECVKNGGDIRECMRENEDCRDLRSTYAHCKKGALDMRTRIRGIRTY